MHHRLWLLWHHFFIWAKHIISHFSGFFMEISTFFISMKNPLKWLIICLACITNNVPHFHNRRCINSYNPNGTFYCVFVCFLFEYSFNLCAFDLCSSTGCPVCYISKLQHDSTQFNSQLSILCSMRFFTSDLYFRLRAVLDYFDV